MLKRVQQQWTTNFSTKSRARGGRVEGKMWGIKLKWGRLKENESQTPYWEKKRPECQNPEGGFRPWGASAVSVRAWTQRANLSLPPPCQKLTQYWGAVKGFEKASEVSSCPPTDATMREQLFELESVLSESSHVCPTDWMSSFRKRRGETLFSITFKSVHFSESL